MIVDVVTVGRFNLHDEMVRMLALDTSFSMPEDTFLYAVAYRPVRRGQHGLIDAWPVVLSLKEPLPVLPLALRHSDTIPLDLNAAYDDACRRSRYESIS